jgi:methyltransferase
MLTLTVLVPAIVYVPMLIEARLAAGNERRQMARGGLEPPDDVYPVMRVAYPLCFAAMIVEGLLAGTPDRAWLRGGLALFAVAKALKWWAVAALGPAWTFRVIVVPGKARVTGGPYRWFRHPNYLGVIGELIAAAMMTGARATGPAAVAGFGLLILRRIAIEERAWRTNSSDPGAILPSE